MLKRFKKETKKKVADHFEDYRHKQLDMKNIFLGNILRRINLHEDIKPESKKRVADIFEDYNKKYDMMKQLVEATKGKKLNKEVDKVIRELEDFLKRQEAEFLKIANKLNLALDQDNMIELTKQNMKKLKTKIGESGGLLQFNYITPITRPLEIFNQENPLDAHPLVVFISYVGVGSDGAMHFVGINIHHVPAQYRKLFWNWIVREFLIKGKNNRRRLEIPQSLYFQLKDNPELRFAIQGYRRYSTKQAKNIHRILLKDYENIFAPRFKARFKVWSQRHSKFIQRPKK